MITTISKKDIINVIGKYYINNYYIETVKQSKEYRVHVCGEYLSIYTNLSLHPSYMNVQRLGTFGMETVYSIKTNKKTIQL